MIREGRFREDLYYRLAMVEVRVPSLAERKDDIALLTKHFIEKFSAQFNKPVSGLTRRAAVVLSRYDWPGNVRELENAIGHACMMVMGNIIDIAELPEHIRQAEYHLTGGAPPSVSLPVSFSADPEAQASLLENTERRLLSEALLKSAGNQSEAARILRIGRDALRYKMKKYGLSG
jgi:DNA-binding NtrC family response regulator